MKFKGYYTKKELEARGWTIKMFKDYLPEPHKRVPNPINPDYAPMGLYKQEVVEAIEATSKFQTYKTWTDHVFRPRMREAARERKERLAAENE